MIVSGGGNFIHLLNDPEGGVILLAWVLPTEQVFLKNRVWLTGWS